jgi:hypothetical protein
MNNRNEDGAARGPRIVAVLHAISVILAVASVVGCLAAGASSNSGGVAFLVLIGGLISAIFFWGFAAVILKLHQILRKLYEIELDVRPKSAPTQDISSAKGSGVLGLQ